MPQSADAALAERPRVTQPRPGRAAAGTAALIVLATVVYYLLPVPGRMHETSWTILFFCGVAVLGTFIVLSVGRLLSAGEDTRARSLILLLCLTVFFFSWSDDTLAKIPGEFAELHTKTDALYFSVSTLATVGFGDVHASGQLARAAVTLQVLFNLVFIGTAVAMLSGLWRTRATRRHAPHHDDGPGRAS
jgi:voltage-gated potassium channel